MFHPTLSLLTTNVNYSFFKRGRIKGRQFLVAKWMGIPFKLQIRTPFVAQPEGEMMPTFEFFRLKTGRYPHPTGSTHFVRLPRLSNGWFSRKKDRPYPVFPGGHSVFTKELEAIATELTNTFLSVTHEDFISHT